MPLRPNYLPLANEHFVQLYQSDTELAEAAAAYALDVVNYGQQAMLFFATRRHCEMVRRSLLLHMDVGGAMARGQLTFVHAEDVLPAIMVGEQVDQARFEERILAYFQQIRQSGTIRHIHVFGELVDLLWRAGNKTATVGLEGYWNHLRKREAFTLYCAYKSGATVSDALATDFKDALCTHSTLMQDSGQGQNRPGRSFTELAWHMGPVPSRSALHTSGPNHPNHFLPSANKP